MSADNIFRSCLICESVHLEANNKVTVLGLYGIAPNVEIRVNEPQAFLTELCFLLFSKRLTDLRPYQVGLSVKDPAGVILFPIAEQVATPTRIASLSFGFQFRPFRLTGTGEYTIHVLVDDKLLDYQSSFRVAQAAPGEIH
jgi:hypothetical protein